MVKTWFNKKRNETYREGAKSHIAYRKHNKTGKKYVRVSHTEGLRREYGYKRRYY